MAMNELLTKKALNVPEEFLRYTAAAGIALGVDVGLLFVLTEFGGLHYLVSATIGFLGGLIVNYFLSVRFVFAKRTLTNETHELFIFSSIGILGLIVHNGLLWTLTEWVGLYYLVSKIIATGFVFLWNFTVRK